MITTCKQNLGVAPMTSKVFKAQRFVYYDVQYATCMVQPWNIGVC